MPDNPTVQFNSEAMARDAVAGILTKDGARTVVATFVQAAAVVAFVTRMSRHGRRRAVLGMVAWLGVGHAMLALAMWGLRRAAEDDEQRGKLPPWAALTPSERSQLIAAVATRIVT